MKFRSVAMRFMKVMLGGAAASMILVTIKEPSTWSDILSALNNVALAGAHGAIGGLILALHKWATWEEEIVWNR